MSYTVLIPAAGSGKRMGAPQNKMLLPLLDIPIIVHTVEQFEADENCAAIYVATKRDEREIFSEILSFSSKLKEIVDGGDERQDSIYNMLQQMEEHEWVMVHDGARPFISKSVLNALYESVQTNDAVICGVRPKDTLKRVNQDIVKDTVNRDEVIMVHTPQAFSYTLLKRAYEHAYAQNLVVTDDSMMVEALGERVHVVESDYNNIKITTQDDMLTGERILLGRDNHV
ncbi:2-C-methyl-D-erythritol 4-phosphate cytidylyltransferase [Aliicoccus persicus]|uniref:2-C-methyl-D-erythritol 4-phosphate cytidylyltransferase n=1 Tax=Aliicoccus persicus TaxID=930138 RepID=A0A662Z3Q6_9STAP|nr:2-C-methyl-D-erythritol 4-phosphate cytidylyltransferase [Aliicoccus persicus]SEW06423.1 2-C-methyl-D-erythritol 4-phosphate cytidylyltransferase [Aliicoccus persicus]